MAMETKMSARTMGRLVHVHLTMSSFTLQKRVSLSANVKQKRLDRSKVLLNELKRGTAGETIWSDEKIFTVEQDHDRRNGRILARKIFCYPLRKKNRSQNNEACHCYGLGRGFQVLEVSPHFC